MEIVIKRRYDWITSTQDKHSGEQFEIKDDNLSPRAGLVFLPLENMAIYTTIGRSYALPWGGIYAAPTKAALLKTDLSELGFKVDLFDESLTFNTAIFNIERENAQTDEQGVVVEVNNDRHQGIEFELKGELLKDWQISSGYTYLDAENQDTGYQPNDVPMHTASLWNTYQLTADFKIGGGITYIGDRYVGGKEAVKLQAYNTIDLMASYQWKSHLIQLNVNNATNQDYYIGATGGGSGSTQINQGAPANANLTYSYAFM